MVEMMPQMLPLEDKRLAKQFQGVYRKRGIEVLLKTKVESIVEYAADHVVAKLSDGSRGHAPRRSWSRSAAAPTAPASAWKTVGVATDARGYVVVNEYLETTVARTSTPSATSTAALLLAHVASYEAFVAVDNCLGARRRARSTLHSQSAPTPLPRWRASA